MKAFEYDLEKSITFQLPRVKRDIITPQEMLNYFVCITIERDDEILKLFDLVEEAAVPENFIKTLENI